jgi:hypothetical protein
MAACWARVDASPRLQTMASRAAQRPRSPGPRLFSGPVLFRRTRRIIVELTGLVWLAIEIARLVRSRLTKSKVIGSGA